MVKARTCCLHGAESSAPRLDQHVLSEMCNHTSAHSLRHVCVCGVGSPRFCQAAVHIRKMQQLRFWQAAVHIRQMQQLRFWQAAVHIRQMQQLRFCQAAVGTSPCRHFPVLALPRSPCWQVPVFSWNPTPETDFAEKDTPDRQDADDLPKPSRNYAAPSRATARDGAAPNCAGRCRALPLCPPGPRPRPQTPDGRQMAPDETTKLRGTVPRNCAGRCRAGVPRPATLSPRPRPQTPDGRQMAPNRVGFIVVSVSSGFRESLTAPSSRFPRRAATIFMEPNTRNRRLRRERHPRQRTHEIPREMRRAVDF